MAACERTPSAPQLLLPPQFAEIPIPTSETAVACKAYKGTVATDSFKFSGVNINGEFDGSFRLAAESCRRIRLHGGDTMRVSATETDIPDGGQLDSVVVYQSHPDFGVTRTNLGAVNTGSVYEGGRPASGGVIVFYNSDVPESGKGCSPGYWKNHPSAWPPTGYTTGGTAGGVFALGGFSSLSSKSLLVTLDGGGGSTLTGAAQILLRAGVAGLLNAAHPAVNYPRTAGAVISSVNAALASNNRDTMLTLGTALDTDNNLSCPLN